MDHDPVWWRREVGWNPTSRQWRIATLFMCGSVVTSWWTAVLNYAGSVFFMIAAIGAVTLLTTDEELNTALVNSGTLAGAVSFFVEAYLLLPAG